MSNDTTTDGKAPHITYSNGTPTGPTKRGPWGSVWGFDRATGDFTVCIRPPNPPQGAEPKPTPQERMCPRCQIIYPFPDTTYWQPITKRGKPTWFSYCRACNAERRRPAAA